MRTARGKSHIGHARRRVGRRTLLLGGSTAALILAGIVSIALGNHSTTTWDFGSAASYTYDANKIEVVGGVAHLRNSFTVTHSTQANFNTGTYDGNTTVYNISAPAGVRLNSPPTAGTYTSPAIDGGVATTTWKTLSHVRDLQQAASATFGAKTAVGAQATVNKINIGDFNRDGAADIAVAASTGANKAIWLYQSNAANPPTFTAIQITDNNAGSCVSATSAGDTVISSVVARYGVGDLNNDLAPDLVEPGKQTVNTKPLFLYVNPLTTAGGATPPCWTRWIVNGRLFDDIRIANINGDTYTSTDPFKNGQPILDVVTGASTIGTGASSSPSGGVFWLRNDGTVAPDTPVFGSRSVDAYTLATATVEGPTTVAVGDINNDGIADIVAGWGTAYNGPLAKANASPQIRGYLSGGGDPPTWTPFTLANLGACGAPPCPNNSNDIWLADIDGDGFLDVVHAANASNTITWYKNPCTSTPCTPTGTWTAFTIDSAATGVTTLAIADLDLDGRPDIVANTTAGVVWYHNNGGNPVTWTKSTLTASAGASGVVVANLYSNGKRAPDIIAAGSSGAGTIDWWPNQLAHSNIRFQVRTWSQGDNTCSTPTGSFVGPDGSAGTYYTATSETLRITNNQCFQYKAFFFTNDATKNPNLESVTVSYVRPYFTDSPSIQPNTGVAYSRLTDFIETLGPGNAGGVGSQVKYQLCKQGDACYYWNGSLWVVASGAAQSNDAATAKASIGFFDDYAGHAAGTQFSTFYFKAFLVSDGTKQVELDAVAVQPDVISATLTRPVGGEPGWQVSDTQNITWNYSCQGSPCGNLKLEYSTDAGSTWSLIADNLINGSNGSCSLGGNTGCYTWTIPASAASTMTRVRVVDKDTPVIKSSSANLTITGAARVISPNGGETFTVNGSTTITWSVTGATNVELRYSTDNFATSTAIVAFNGSNGGCVVPLGATGCYPWTVPDAISTTVKIKVTDTANAALTDTSDTAFTIAGAVTVTAPNGGQTFTVGDPITISWSTLGSIPTVKLEYSTNGGSTWTVITASTASTPATPPTLGSGSYAWTAPTATSTQFRIRASDANTVNRPATSDISDANFTVKGTIAAQSPTPGMVAGETYTVGNAATIAWATTGTIPTIKIEYSTNGFVDETQTTQVTASATNGANGGCTIPVGATGCYTWTLPDAASAAVKLRVSDARPEFSATVRASAPNTFTVRGGLSVTSPVGTDVWSVGQVKTISWSSTGAGAIPTVNLEYSKNGLFTDTVVIATGLTSGPTGGTYSWTVADAIASTVKVRVKHPTDATVAATSPAFTIKGALALTAPVGGEVWGVGSTQNITWTTGGTLADVKLEYSRDNFAADIQTITLSTPAASGSFAWTVPDAISTTVKVRITLNSDATVTQTSPANFKIRGSLTLTVPNGGETWAVGDTRTITWTKAGTLADVKLEYSTDGGVTYPNVITASTPAANLSYAWTVPDAISTTVKVRITLNADATVTANSNATFTIKGSLTLTAPNGGEAWTVGSSQNITWTRTGSIANVKLEYSTDGGATYPNLITASTPAAAGSYAWTVPDLASSNVKVRVTNTADATVFAVSNAVFTIKGGLSVTAPVGTDVWTVGAVKTISWTSTGAGAISTVNLEYSKNGLFTDTVVIATGLTSGPTGGSYSWTVADAIASTVKVRVKHSTDATVAATSAAFTIKGALALTAPVGGEAWGVGSTQNITWTTGGTLADVKLEYSRDNFVADVQTITLSTPAASGSFAWTVPDATSTTVKVRITLNSDATVTQTSPANFKIRGSLALTAPNGGETWIVGDTRTITWTKTGTLADVKLEYSTDGGVTYPNVITASTPAANLSYAWTVPDAISTTVKVRITLNADGTVTANSNATFTIKGSLTLTAPNGGEAWTVGSSQNITWTRTGSIANVKLEYSTDGGTTYPNLITASTPAAAGSYAWTVPDLASSSVKVRVTSTADATVFTASNAVFTIKGGLSVTAPVGTDVWTVGAVKTISWTSTGAGAISTVNLEYSKNGLFTDTVVIATAVASGPTGGSYSWTVADAIASTVKVRVKHSTDATVAATSAAFTIKGALALTAPVGGEAWAVGSTRNITWTRQGSIANVKVEYSKDNFVTPILITASTSAASLSYAWTVPDDVSTTVKVRITNLDDASVASTSPANFSIRGSLTLTAPNGGESWPIGSVQTITWTKTGTMGTVRLEYSTDGGLTYPNLITASPAASALSYAWTVPDTPTSQARVKITQTDDTSVTDSSDANFGIKGTVTLTAPNGGETWLVGESRNITWMKTGAIANVKLEYSTDGGTTYPNLITASTPAASLSYAWTVPDAVGTGLRVRIADAGDATTSDTSDGNFTIKGSLTLTSPVGGEVWTVGASRNISWTKTGTIAAVKLEYSTNGGTTYPNLITASTPAAAGSYAWTVPDTISATVRVRITNVDDATVTSSSGSNFKIQGALTLTAPNGGETWIVGESRNVTWTRIGSITNVKLEYSTDGGATYPNVIAASTPAAAGSYAWVIPDTPSATVKVRISDVSDATVSATSNANFAIKTSLTLTAPNGGEVWAVGSAKTITWTKAGTVATVKLEYSTDNFVTASLITASTDGALGSYAWTVPDSISATVKVRVTNTADATVADTSDANFKIAGSLTLTAPNGGEKWGVNTLQNITWTKTGSIANVRLDYSANGTFSDAVVIVASTPAAAGSYAWTIPDALSTTVKVRVTDASDSTVTDASDAAFTILAGFTLSSPNGGEVWTVGSSQNITWTTGGSVPNVKLAYSTDGGSTYPNVIIASTPNTGTFAWTVPDTISATVRVRVSDVNNSDAFGTSNSNFKIRGALALTAPNGGEVWTVGESRTIAWTTTGTIANIKLEYSKDNFTTPILITASAPNTGTFAWTVPDDISSTVKVRVTNVNDATVFAVSAATFKIQGALTVTSPNGGEKWTVGSSRAITWTKTGSIANVKLEYSKDNFATTTVIAASTPNTGSYTWTVPNDISATVKVRVADAGDATVNDVSDANFKVLASFAVSSPNGGEIWTVGGTQAITWTTSGTVPNVKLEFSKDNFATATVITGSTPNTGTYSWIIPDSISATVKVRVSDPVDAEANDVSDGNFKIRGGLVLSAPNGGETWTVGSAQAIAWTTSGTVPNVKLEYSTDGGVTYPNVVVASVANTGSFSWTIPDSISNTVRVRLSDATDASANDTSDGNFKIRGNLTVTAPNGGEVWIIGSAQTITWTSTGTIPSVKLEYSKDNFATATLIAASVANTGSFAWTVPDNASTTVKMRVTNTADATVFDDSNANFTIRGGFILSAPNGGEEWVVGSTRQISWTTTGSTIANVKLEYTRDNFATATVITPSTPNAGFYNWLVPNDISATVKVRVSDPNDPGTNDASDAVFKIKGGFALTAPNGGEVWAVGTTQSISWTNTGSVPSVKLEYSTDNFATTTVIVTSAANTGSFNWVVPDSISTTTKIRISDAADASANDVSDNNFKIRGGITVSAPNGGELWTVGQSRSITWTTSGTIPNVRLEYSKDNFTSLVLITASAAGTGSFAWTVPDDLSSTVKVRVTDVRDLSVFDDSNAYFKIQGALTLSSPNGGEKLTVGSAQSITWTSVGSIANVKLQYSKDNFATAVLIAASTPNTGNFAWTVPNDISSTVKVRVTDAGDVSVFDDSDAAFKIQGGFTLTAPNGGEAWLVNTPRTITWNKSGSVSNVKLEYSTDGGATYTGLIAASANNGTNTANGGCTVADPATQGCYVWIIPDTVSAAVKVRISDASDATTSATSNSTFRIRAAFTLASPNGGEQWLVGSTRTITWSAVGNVPAVKLEYARSPYVTFTAISAAAPGTPTGGSFSWTVPNDISSTADLKVRVSDPNDPEANDLSDNPFKITAALALTSPNGGEQWAVGSVHPITWTSTGSLANVKLEYSKDDFATSTVIVASTPNSGTYTWTIPDSISATVKVRVSDVTDPDAKDLSDATFKITSLMTLLSPNGGEKWDVASVHPITWTATGTVANVKLEYSKDNFATATVITATAPNTGSYNWTIPDAISTSVKVRITDVSDPAASDSSDASFKIQGAFTLTTPNGGEAWKINTTQTISWTTSGTMPNVKLEYSKDNFVADVRVMTASVANTGSYSWLVPDDPTTTAKVRVSDVNDATVLDTSDANFRIEGFFTVTAPNGGEVWPVGSTQSISWVSGGTIPNVKIEYSRDNFATATLIAASAPSVSNVGGSFAWTVPDAISSTVKVRVTDANNSAVGDVSDANFSIRAGFTMTAPNGGERWITNEDRAITWTALGTVANVKLEYSVDNFATSTVIVASTPNTGSYTWAVPDLPTVTVSNPNLRNARATRVRVSDADAGHPAASDASDADFNVDYYLVKWLVRDVVLGTELSGLTVKHSVTVDGVETVTWSESVLTSPILRDVPANPKNLFGNRVPYKAVWSKSGYFDGSKDYMADGICRDDSGNPNPAFCPDSDLRFVIPMESTLVHTNKAVSGFVYDAPTNFFTVSSWLERDGNIVPAVQEAKVEIYDPDSATPATPIATLDALCTVDHSTHPHPAGLPASCPDDQGIFRQKWDFTGRTAKSYKVVTTTTMSSGSGFSTAQVLDAAQQVGIGRALGVPAAGSPDLGTQITTATTNIRSDVAGVQTTVLAIQQDTTAIKQDTTTLKQDTTAIKQATEVTIPGKLDALQANVIAILEDTSTKLPQRLTTLEAEVKDGMKAKILNRPTTVKRGNTISVEFQSVSGLSPVVTLYDPANAPVVINAPMTEVGTTGVYRYMLPVNTAWTLGDYTVMVTEPTKGSLESMVLTVADADIPSIAADITNLPAQVSASVDAAAAKVDAAAVKVDAASATATTAAAAVEKAAGVATAAAGEVEKASATAKEAAGDVAKAGEEVRAIGERLEGRFKKVEDAASGAQGLASMAATAADDAKKVIESVRTELGAKGKTQTTYDLIVQLQALLSAVQTAVAKIPETVNSDGRQAETVRAEALQASVQEVNALLKKISGEGDTSLDAMYESIAETTADVGDLKGKVERLKDLLELIREVGDKVLDRTPPKKPAIKTWFEPGGAIQ